MARRSTRKVRHRSDAPKVFTFKQRTQMGVVSGKINRKEITLEEIQNDPEIAWMLDAWNEIKQDAQEQIEALEPEAFGVDVGGTESRGRVRDDGHEELMMELPAEFPFQAQEPETNESIPE